MDLGMDLEKYITNQLKGSSVIDSAIAQVFGTSPIDMKLKEIGDLLSFYGIKNFDYIFDPKCLVYTFRVSYEGFYYHGAIGDATLRGMSVEYLADNIYNMVMTELIADDPEYRFENENEQAMLDAAMDYGFV